MKFHTLRLSSLATSVWQWVTDGATDATGEEGFVVTGAKDPVAALNTATEITIARLVLGVMDREGESATLAMGTGELCAGLAKVKGN